MAGNHRVPAGWRLEGPGSSLRSCSPAGPPRPSRGALVSERVGVPAGRAPGAPLASTAAPRPARGAEQPPPLPGEALCASGLGPPPPRVCGRVSRVTRTHQPPEWGQLGLAPSADKVSGEVFEVPRGTGLAPALRSQAASFRSCPCHVLTVALGQSLSLSVPQLTAL